MTPTMIIGFHQFGIIYLIIMIEVYDVSFWDIDYQTWSWAYHYIYTYYETLNEIYGYFVDGDSPGDPFWYSGTDTDANGLTHTVYQDMIATRIFL